MSDLQNVATCPVCGAVLSQEQSSEGFCLACLMELALESPSVMAELDSPQEAPTLVASDFDNFEVGVGSFSAGVQCGACVADMWSSAADIVASFVVNWVGGCSAWVAVNVWYLSTGLPSRVESYNLNV